MLAGRWGAPTARSGPLEAYLLRPVEVSQRIGTLSGSAVEALESLVEATSSDLPAAALWHDAVGELVAAALVSVEGELVTICDEVAVAACDVLTVTPCRIRLLVHELGADRLHELAGHLSAATGERVSRTHEVCAALSSMATLRRVLNRLSPHARRRLEELVAAGGVSLNKAHYGLEELEQFGLVWQTRYDVRVAVEVLEALLTLELEDRTVRARQAWFQLTDHAGADNLHLLPLNVGGILDGLFAREGGKPNGVLRSESRFREETGLVDRAFPAGTLMRRLRGLGGLDGFNGTAVVTALVENFVLGLDDESSGLEALFGPRVEGEMAEGCEDECWAVLSPHAVAELDELSAPPGTSQALIFFRLAAQRVLASLLVGSVVSVSEFATALEALAAVSRCAGRLVSQPYLPEPSAPARADAVERVCLWLLDWPTALGWVRAEPHPVALSDGRSDERAHGYDPRNMSLFMPGTAGWDDVASPASRTVSAPTVPELCGVDSLRIVSRPPALAELADGVLAQWPDRIGTVLAGLLRFEPATWGESVQPSVPVALSARTLFGSQLNEFLRDRRAAHGGSVRLLEGFLFARGLHSLAHLTDSELSQFLASYAPGATGDWARSDIVAVFEMLAELAEWAHQRGQPFPEVQALRLRFEGPWLRVHSARAALLAFRGVVPPRPLLRERPEAAHTGLAAVRSLDPAAGVMRVEPLDGVSMGTLGIDAAHRGQGTARGGLHVVGDPRPLLLMRVGDLIDGQFVRYGELCWLANLRAVLPA